MTIQISIAGSWLKFGATEDFRGPDGLRVWNDAAVEERAYLGAPGVDWISVPERRKLMVSFSGVRTFADETARDAFVATVGSYVEANTMINGGSVFSYSMGNVKLEITAIIGLSVRVGVVISAGRYV